MQTNLSATERPVRASVSIPPIRKAEVKVVNDDVVLRFVDDEYWTPITVYLTPEVARDIADQLDSAADQAEEIFPGVLVDEPLIGAVR